MKTLSTFLLLLGLSVGTSQGQASPPNRVTEDTHFAQVLNILDSWIDTRVAGTGQPGLSIGIVYDGDLVFARGYGFADLASQTPATPLTLYRIASNTKLFTATAIMQLRDAGELQLYDPVKKFLPWFSFRDPGNRVVTISQLLTHTSGLPREAAGVNWNDLIFPSREEMLQRLGTQEMVFPAETQWKYSNLAMSLAGEVVAAVSGKPWNVYVERHILQPLGMTSTRTLPRDDTPGLAVGYRARLPGETRKPWPFIDLQAERPAGNIASNVEDLSRFLAFQMGRGPETETPVLSPATLQEMHRVHWVRPDWKGGWGLGFSVSRVGQDVRVGHGGDLPGYLSQIQFSPARKLGVVVLTNASDAGASTYLNKAFELVEPAVARFEKAHQVPATPDPSWEKYVGTYTCSWKNCEMQVLILNGELAMITPGDSNPIASRVTLEPVGENTFRAHFQQWSGGFNGDLVRFSVNQQGQAKRVETPNFYWTRK